MATESKKVRRDAFVKNVRPDPKSTEELVLLQGYIGDSDLAGHIRVYSDPLLSDFIELPEQDILYAEPVSTTEDPLGGSRLWVKKTTVFTAGDPRHTNRIKSSFLEGDIVKAFGDTAYIPTAIVPNTFAAACQSVKPKSCCETHYKTCNQPSCRPTCIQPSCDRTCQPSCLRTCDQPTCFQTSCGPQCEPTHFQTCNQPSICRPCEPVSEFQPSCFKTCDRPTPPLTQGCTIWGDCTALTICLQFAPTTNLGTTRPGYAGGFNPYTTG